MVNKNLILKIKNYKVITKEALERFDDIYRAEQSGMAQEVEAFLPIYDEYQDKLRKLYRKRDQMRIGPDGADCVQMK